MYIGDNKTHNINLVPKTDIVFQCKQFVWHPRITLSMLYSMDYTNTWLFHYSLYHSNINFQ